MEKVEFDHGTLLGENGQPLGRRRSGRCASCTHVPLELARVGPIVAVAAALVTGRCQRLVGRMGRGCPYW